MNGLDIAILIIILISALIALNRGLIKEVLSIIGWFFGIIAIIYLLPYIQPIAEKHIESDLMSVIISAFTILIVFFIIWIYLTAIIISKIRASKLNGIDRVLGLFFGILRAFLLIILLNILVSWIMPPESQPEIIKQSKYFKLASSFAQPIEELIPQSTREKLHQQVNMQDEKDDVDFSNNDINNLFENLTQPKIKKKEKESKTEKPRGYDSSEQKSLDRLIEMTVDE